MYLSSSLNIYVVLTLIHSPLIDGCGAGFEKYNTPLPFLLFPDYLNHLILDQSYLVILREDGAGVFHTRTAIMSTDAP